MIGAGKLPSMRRLRWKLNLISQFRQTGEKGRAFTNASSIAILHALSKRHSFRSEFLRRVVGPFSRGGVGEKIRPGLCCCKIQVITQVSPTGLVPGTSGCRDWRTGQCLFQGRREIQWIFAVCFSKDRLGNPRKGREGGALSRGSWKLQILSGRKKGQSAFCLLVRSNERSPQMDQGLGIKTLGDRSR